MPSEPSGKSSFCNKNNCLVSYRKKKTIHRGNTIRRKKQPMWQDDVLRRLLSTPSKHLVLAERRMLKQVKNSELRFSPPRQR